MRYGCRAKSGPVIDGVWMGVLSEVWDEVEFLRVIKQR